MKLPLLQPSITVKLPFKDEFIDFKLQDDTSNDDRFQNMQLNLTLTPIQNLAATKPPAGQ
jgi:hypothetical protein